LGQEEAQINTLRVRDGIMKRTLFTVVNREYQEFLPLWAKSARDLWPDIEIKAVTTTPVPIGIIAALRKLGVTAGLFRYGFAPTVSSSCLRFVIKPDGEQDQVLVTDADVVFTSKGLWDVLEKKMHDTNELCGVYQGSWVHPKRAVAPHGWVNEMQRIAGGFCLFTKEWYDRTELCRPGWWFDVEEGNWGTFRESDEVMLCRIMRECNVPLPDHSGFPVEHRGLHLGDFKPSMDHRWRNKSKMRNLLHDAAFSGACAFWRNNQDLIRETRNSGSLAGVTVSNFEEYAQNRGPSKGPYRMR